MVDFIISALTDEYSTMLDEQLMTLKKHNFSHIEIRNIDGKDILELSDENLRIVSRKLEFDEVDVTGICSKIGRVSINEKFDIQLEEFKRVVEVANILSTTRVRISSWFIPENEDYSNYHNKVIEQLSILSEYAIKQKVNCFVENEKLSYMNTSKRVQAINKELKDYIKFVFNPANTLLTNETPYNFYLNVNKLIDYFYIKDVTTEGVIVPCCEGICDINKMLLDHKNNNQTVLVLQPGLFISNDSKDNHKYHYENNIVAFDVAMNNLKSTLEKEGFSYI